MPSPPSSSYGLHLTASWRPLQGAGFAVTQSGLVARISTTIPQQLDFSAIDQLFGTLLESPGTVSVPASDPRLGLIERIVLWHLCVQRQQKIPVFGPYYIAAIDADQAAFDVAVPSFEPEATTLAFRWMREAVNSLIGTPSPSASSIARVRADFESLLGRLQKHALVGVNNFHLMAAAHACGIPSLRISRDTFCFGQGHRARWFNSTITDRTPSMGVKMSKSKTMTAHVLALHGLPVPVHELAKDEGEALQVAARLGWPVVVKPDDHDQGRGVEAGLRDEAGVRRAFASASALSSRVLVEKHHFGEDYRLTVLHDRVVKILHRRAGGVTGDGRQSVAQLIAASQMTERAVRIRRQSGRELLALDSEANGLLQEQGLAAHDIPAQGAFVVLRRRNNISAGGIQTLVPVEDAHPDNLALAVRATRAIRLDISGVDLLIADIRRSWLETGACIIEMNSQPQVGIQNAPHVYEEIIRAAVPGDGRIPVHLVLCATQADEPSDKSILERAAALGCNGVATRRGLWVSGQQVAAAFTNPLDAGRALLLDDRVTSALCVMTARDAVVCGLPSDQIHSLTVAGPQDAPVVRAALVMAAPHVKRPTFGNTMAPKPT